MVENDRGHARIRRRGDEFQYTAVSGDPLELGRLEQGSKANFKTDKEWFEETAGHRYPDAVANVYKSVFTARETHRRRSSQHQRRFLLRLVTLRPLRASLCNPRQRHAS